MALPFQPGFSFNRKLGQEKFHKSHCFDYRNDVSVYVGEHKDGIGGEPLPGGKAKPKRSCFPKGVGKQAPAWVAFDKQVLCFDGYFQEAVHEKREEKFRVRKCKILFYLEDDSIQVVEPKVENSGIPQGTLIRRHRIPLPPPNDDQYYTVEHFNIGKEIVLYSRTFKITGSDDFTFNFLRKLGLKVGAKETSPNDPYTLHRKEIEGSMQPLRPYEKEDSLRQFLENDRRVLRFYCLWDDSESMFGDLRQMVVHYFLADDTVEIREIIPPNAGKDAVPLFLRRQRLPKIPAALPQPGQITNRTVLNVFGPMGHGGRYILDSLKTGAVHTDFYHDSDLMIGKVLNVWGRPFLICDCDDFTQEYYRSKYGLENFDPILVPKKQETLPSPEIPPYNSFGSEEDSLQNCLYLIPKPPRHDFIKFMEKDRQGLEGNILSFVARLDTTRPIDVGRRFIVSYFLSDDTISVFEPPQRNSGIIGGKFLERGRIKKPNEVDYYSAQDLFIGNTVEFYKHQFVLIDADEYAVDYMEKHADEFRQSNINAILPKLANIAASKKDEFNQFFAAHDAKGTGQLPFSVFTDYLVQLGEGQISNHEAITVARSFGESKSSDESLDVIVATVQEQMRKNNFENFQMIEDACVYHDEDGTGCLSLKEVRNICKSFKLPLRDCLLDSLLERTERDASGNLRYGQLINFLNWRDNPMLSQVAQSTLAHGIETRKRIGPQESLTNVFYKDLISVLSL